MNINELTIGEAKELAAIFGGAPIASDPQHEEQSVLVCTDKRGVVFGTTTNAKADPIVLTNARMCLYWSADVGGVFGLADIGPTIGCKISAQVPEITLSGVTAVFAVTEEAVAEWRSAPVQGR